MQDMTIPSFDYFSKSYEKEVSDAYVDDLYRWWGAQEDIAAIDDFKDPAGYTWHFQEHCEPYSPSDIYRYFGYSRRGYMWSALLQEGVEITRKRRSGYAWRVKPGDRLLIEMDGDKPTFCGEQKDGVRHGFGTEFTTLTEERLEMVWGLWQNGTLTHVVKDNKLVPVES